MTTTTRPAGNGAACRRVRVSGSVGLTVTAGGRHTAGRLDAAPGQPLIVTFDDPALALAQLPRPATLRAAAATLTAALGRIEVRRADGTWLLRIYWHAGRVRRWWSPAGLRVLPRVAVLSATTQRGSRW
ncbi:hypothetical protein [Catellatospora sp. NPDC049609]|uniref:hypothetical protein n=1 Tax=Catellatospora sp. NPDC049609 TaxID=3155505 RepID=UPI0034350C88